MPEIKSTLRVFNEKSLESGPGVVSGQTIKMLAGVEELPTERIFVGLASFEAGTYEGLHWHPVEVFYFIVSGRAIVCDLEGNAHEVVPGSVVYAPPGLAGSHDWDIKEPTKLIFVRATTEKDRVLQFEVDKNTLESKIDFDLLSRHDGIQFRSHY